MQANGPDDYSTGGPPPAQPATPAPPGYPPQPPAPPGYPQAPPMYQPLQPRHMPNSGYNILAKVHWGGVGINVVFLLMAVWIWLTVSEEESMGDYYNLVGTICLIIFLVAIVVIVLLVFSIIGLIRIYQTAKFMGGELAERTKTGIIVLIVGVVLGIIPYINLIAGIVQSIGRFLLLLPLMRDEYRPWAIGFLVGSIVMVVASSIFAIAIGSMNSMGMSDMMGSEGDPDLLLPFFVITLLFSIALIALYAVLLAKAGEQAAALWQERGLPMTPPAPVMPYGGAPPQYPPSAPPPAPPQYPPSAPPPAPPQY